MHIVFISLIEVGMT